MDHYKEDWSLYSSAKSNTVLRGVLDQEALSHKGLLVRVANHLSPISIPLANNLTNVSETPIKLFEEFSDWKPFGGLVYAKNHYSEYFGGRCNYGEVELNRSGKQDYLYVYGNSLPSLINFIRQAGSLPCFQVNVLIIGNTDHSVSELCKVAGISDSSELFRIFQCDLIYSVNNDSCNADIISLPIGLPANKFNEIVNVNIDLPRISKILVILKKNTPLRVQAIEICRKYPDIFEVITERVPLDRYQELLATYSHILCLPGQGLDTYRIWEALALSCVPICPNVNPLNTFVGNHNCFNSLNSMYDECKHMLLFYKHVRKQRFLLTEEYVLQKIFRSEKILDI